MRKWAAVCLLPALLVLAAGCAKKDDGKDVATAGGAPSAAASAAGSDQDKMLKYVQCLRDHGAQVADPGPDGGMKADGVDPAVVQKASEACRDLDPGSPSGNRRSLDPEAQKRALAYAKCMRQNGVAEFPDPSDNGAFNVGKADKDPDLKKAEQACAAANPFTAPSAGPTS
jgi:hypothetical protein